MRLKPEWTQGLLRPKLHTETFVLASAAYIVSVCNLPFWRALSAGRDWTVLGTWAFFAAMVIAVTALYTALACALVTRWTVLPTVSLLLILSAALSFFTSRYGIYFDSTMLQNVLATDAREATELLSWELMVYVALLGVVPAAILWWPVVAHRKLVHAAGVRAAWIFVGLLVAVGALLPVFADVASAMRNNREVRHLLTPGNAVAAVAKKAFGRGSRPTQLKLVGQDARLADSWQRRRRTLFVLVVGETARAQSFSLNGYQRSTNPKLAERSVVNFAQTTACGTSTEVSLPCMFSA